MDKEVLYETDVKGKSGKYVLIYNGSTYRAVVIVEYLDFFETYEPNKFVRITGMRKYYKHDVSYVIVVESDKSAKLIEKELKLIDFQHRIIDNDYHALEKLAKGYELIEKPYFEEPFYE